MAETSGHVDSTLDAEVVRRMTTEVLLAHPPQLSEPAELMGALFDAGLVWINFPRGLGGLGAPRTLQTVVNAALAEAGAPTFKAVAPIGYGIVAPTLAKYLSHDVAARLLRSMATGEEKWCQLFSEPGAGSDLAGLATRAVRDGDEWVVNGQKVWNSLADQATWGILLTRSDPDVPKHSGLTYFIVRMDSPGVEVRPFRQITGQAHFNEVFLTDVRIPDSQRLGGVGEGWTVARYTLSGERMSLGDRTAEREAGVITDALHLWDTLPDRRTEVLRQRLVHLWARAENHRLTSLRARIRAATGVVGPESSISKVVSSELTQAIYDFCVDLLGADATTYETYDPHASQETHPSIQRSYLRARATTIEGGTSEIMRNVIGERVLGLPSELLSDRDRPWKDVPRS